MKYSYFYKEHYSIENLEGNYDLFISAFNKSDRVNLVFNKIKAKLKHWIIFPEYHFDNVDLLSLGGEVFDYSTFIDKREDDILIDYYRKNKNNFEKNIKIGIDITGMLRPYIVFFLRILKNFNINNIDFIYSEPKSYKNKEETEFSMDSLEVQDIVTFLGSHIVDNSNDYLIFGSGYDFHRIIKVAKEKKQARKIQILGFPPLQADMFQQNVLKANKAEEDAFSAEFDLDSDEIILSPAYDPFITAEKISQFVKNEERKKKITNLYLCPLSTKAQTLGIALYYLFECEGKAASIIFPFCKKYSNETSEGVSKIWKYTIQFPN